VGVYRLRGIISPSSSSSLNYDYLKFSNY